MQPCHPSVCTGLRLTLITESIVTCKLRVKYGCTFAVALVGSSTADVRHVVYAGDVVSLVLQIMSLSLTVYAIILWFDQVVCSICGLFVVL